MIKKLALIEESMHNEVLWAYYHSQKDNFDQIHICCHQLCFEQLYDLHDVDTIIWHTWEDSNGFLTFLRTRSKELSGMPRIVFTTILPKSFAFFNKHSFNNSAVVIHDMHLFFAASANFRIRWTSPLNGIKDLLKVTRYYVLGEKRRNLAFLRPFETLIFPSRIMEKQLSKLSNDKWNTEVWPFAVRAQKRSLKRPKTSFFEIVIPGTIIRKSRDYNYVLETLQDFDFKKYGDIRITLLGRAIDEYGRKIQQQFRRMWSNTRIYDEFIPQKEFDEVMYSANLLMLPIQSVMGIYPIIERNGYTCVSGNINDMVKYQIPALMPAFYPVEDTQETLTKTYSSKNEFRKKLLEILQNIA